MRIRNQALKFKNGAWYLDFTFKGKRIRQLLSYRKWTAKKLFKKVQRGLSDDMFGKNLRQIITTMAPYIKCSYCGKRCGLSTWHLKNSRTCSLKCIFKLIFLGIKKECFFCKKTFRKKIFQQRSSFCGIRCAQEFFSHVNSLGLIKTRKRIKEGWESLDDEFLYNQFKSKLFGYLSGIDLTKTDKNAIEAKILIYKIRRSLNVNK